MKKIKSRREKAEKDRRRMTLKFLQAPSTVSNLTGALSLGIAPHVIDLVKRLSLNPSEVFVRVRNGTEEIEFGLDVEKTN